MGGTLVAYFSATGTTRSVAGKLAEAVNADVLEIRPEVPYTSADLDWTNAGSRSSVEMNDPSGRPALADAETDVSAYDVILLGFPIWWGRAPTIVNTFLESCDLAGKRIVLFATSGGSGMGRTADGLKASVPQSCRIVDGGILGGRDSVRTLREWADGVLRGRRPGTRRGS